MECPFMFKWNVFYMIRGVLDETGTEYAESREGRRGCPWCHGWSAPSVKGIDAVLRKVHLPCPLSPCLCSLRNWVTRLRPAIALETSHEPLTEAQVNVRL